jgi:ABC-2 type transport system ATP-binding protein
VISVTDIKKAFGATQALDGVSMEVERGTVFGLLGPNGAGKTTLVRVLATLARPDSGRATIDGVDVLAQPEKIRSMIGLAGQFAAVDPLLTGRENLEMVGRLYRLGSAEAKRRAGETLERLSLSDAADRQVKTYSGGMRRRLDLGASLVGRAQVMILDEPTTGLDPRTRLELWSFLEDLVRDGITVLLTTQYLEEADRLARQIMVIDHGRVIAQGTADELKNTMGGDVIDLRFVDGTDFSSAIDAIKEVSKAKIETQPEERRASIPVASGAEDLIRTVRLLDQNGLRVDDLVLRRPTLDDVFLSLTGRATDKEEPAAPKRGRKKGAQ